MFAAYRIAWNNRPGWPYMRDFAAFVSLSSGTSPGGLAGAWAIVDGGARLPCSGCGGARGVGAAACLSLGLVAQLVRARA
jgi:hypothetical protein